MSSASALSRLISFTPLIQSAEHNLIRIERTNDIPRNVHLVAAGPLQGIIISKLTQDFEELPTQFPCSFSVWISKDGGKVLKQEIRSFRFCFFKDVPLSQRAATSQRFIKNLFEKNFPKDYASFFKLLLNLFKSENYPQLQALDIEIKFAADSEKMPMPSAKQYVNDGELENLTSGHVKEVLEHAYPNSVTKDVLAESLRCTLDEVTEFLGILEKSGLIECVNEEKGEWIRKTQIQEPTHQARQDHPTVAIITCLYPEKQSVDMYIENSNTVYSYSTFGESNVYTFGEIGGHRVVSTKLSMIGGDRVAATSAGSLTTRLLGVFQHIQHVIIVGIGGGVPHFTDPEMHVRLGDVVVSHSIGDGDESTNRPIGAYVYAHNVIGDMETLTKRSTINGLLEVREWTPKENTLAQIVRNWDRKDFLLAWHQDSEQLINKLNKQYETQELDFSRPPHDTDVLTVITGEGKVVVFPHPNANRTTPLYHLGPVGSMFTLCEKPATKAPTIPNTPLKQTAKGKEQAENLKEQNRETNAETETINSQQLNEQLRDRFISEYHLRAYDTGFDSVIAAIVGSRVDSWVLIRGVADYQQGTTKLGKRWQHYASANAAAMVRTILSHIPAATKN